MRKRGQSVVEYSFLCIIFIAAVIIMAPYIKRAVQGNWHSNAASLFPEIYDPNNTTILTPFRIRVSNYTFGIREGAISYSRRPASWISGGSWTIWSK